MHVGAYEILPVWDGNFRAEPTVAYRNTTAADWEPHKDLLDADGMLTMSLGGFLVRGSSDERLVLIDAGLGHHPLFNTNPGGNLPASLAAYGLRPDQITEVIFTHLHLDHIGWAFDEGKAHFERATLRCDERDWAFWMERPADAYSGGAARLAPQQRQILEPVRDRFEMWSADGAVLPGINVLLTPGHTPGSATVVVSSGADRAYLLGDAVHCPIELLEDEWGGLGDVDPALAGRTRNALARELEGKDVPVTAAHFPGLKFGRLLAAEGRRRWVVKE